MLDKTLDPATGRAPRGKKRGRVLAVVLALLVAIALGGAAAVWGGTRLGWLQVTGQAPLAPTRPAGAAPRTVAAPSAPMPGADTQTALGVRLAELEQRMARLGLQAEQASGNAARAEGLLIAFAARRAVERGERLGYLEDQLKLRFGNAQPNAVETLVEAAARPVTLDTLAQGLQTLAPTLVAPPRDTDAWTRLRGEVAELFVLRRIDAPSPAPEQRLERARRFLESGRVELASAEVQRMPGRAVARTWLGHAQRYVRAQRALDLIETAAILEPRQLQDGTGAPVPTPSPLAPPPGTRI